jgi:hypothetical protein
VRARAEELLKPGSLAGDAPVLIDVEDYGDILSVPGQSD